MSSIDIGSAMTFSHVQVGNRSIYMGELGAGEPVVMLHGGGPGASGVSNFSKNIEALAEKFRVIVPDLPGYGQSSKGVNGSDPFGDLATAISGLLTSLGLESAHLVGNSYGGACALRMALDNPAQTRSLVLMGPGGVNTTRGAPSKGLKTLLGYYTGSGPSREKIKKFICDYLVYDSSRVPEEIIEKRYQDSIDPEVVANPPLQRPKSLAAALRMDFTRDERLASCEVPTLVVWGTEDKVNRPSGGPALQKRMPNCDLYLISRAGHWVQWEEPELFNAVTAGFIERYSTAEA